MTVAVGVWVRLRLRAVLSSSIIAVEPFVHYDVKWRSVIALVSTSSVVVTTLKDTAIATNVIMSWYVCRIDGRSVLRGYLLLQFRSLFVCVVVGLSCTKHHVFRRLQIGRRSGASQGEC